MARGDYRELKRLLLHEDLDPLRRGWSGLDFMGKAVLFKLMEPNAAMEFYRRLPFEEKYFLFCAFDRGSIAPVLEDLPPRMRSLFHHLPKECYDEMFRRLT